MPAGANLFAYIALFGWPLISIYLFFSMRLPVAFAIAVLGADLLLPSGFSVKFEMIPQLDKGTIGSLSAMAGCFLRARYLPRPFSRFFLLNLFIVGYMLGPFVTSVLNGDPVQSGMRVIPGVGLYDAGSALLSQFILFSPLLLARQVFRSDQDILELLRVLVIAGLLYSVLLLFEIRMSPQLHYWVYGFYPSDFSQAIRGGGFRPMAFMGHGLLASLFLMSSVVAAAVFWRMRIRIAWFSAAGVSVYLAAVLVACKSLGAFLYGAILAPLVRWSSPRTQIRAALVLAVVSLAYPVLRTYDFVPRDALLDFARSISDDRASSLSFRFENEDRLLAKASERFWFGWGRYGRNRIYDDYGSEVVTDGRWIITFGQFGAFGFICEFGLLALPIFYAWGALRRAHSREAAILLGALALIQGARIIDQLPNASINPWAWLLAGALLGKAELSRRRPRDTAESSPSRLSQTQPNPDKAAFARIRGQGA